MLITLENDQDKIVIDDALKSRLVAGLNLLHACTDLQSRRKLTLPLLMTKKYTA